MWREEEVALQCALFERNHTSSFSKTRKNARHTHERECTALPLFWEKRCDIYTYISSWIVVLSCFRTESKSPPETLFQRSDLSQVSCLIQEWKLWDKIILTQGGGGDPKFKPRGKQTPKRPHTPYRAHRTKGYRKMPPKKQFGKKGKEEGRAGTQLYRTSCMNGSGGNYRKDTEIRQVHGWQKPQKHPLSPRGKKQQSTCRHEQWVCMRAAATKDWLPTVFSGQVKNASGALYDIGSPGCFPYFGGIYKS